MTTRFLSRQNRPSPIPLKHERGEHAFRPRVPALRQSQFNSEALLDAWEQGASQPPIMRALILLAAAWPEQSLEEWARATMGVRDGRLLSLREEIFGGRLEATTACPKCGERVELAFNTSDICVPARALPDPVEALRVEIDGCQVTHRLPTSADLLEVAEMGTANGHHELLRRCVETARIGGEVVDPHMLPDEVVNSVAEHMASADPQAEVQIAIACPTCMNQWQAPFDILSYLWSELGDLAQRMLLEIHALASAYGWSERDILAMSPQRRRVYLDMVGA